MKLCEYTIKQAAEGLRKKEFSSLDLTESCLKAIEERDQKIHAFLDVFEEDARERAKAADGVLKNGKSSPLLGIPSAIKDNILIFGTRTTAGSKILEDYLASYDATVIEKLKSGGAIFLGKTNLDEFAMGASTENSAFGATLNPNDLSRVAGGSSGGSAAAVAANECIFALGSDTGGSIRQPAAFCGVVGLKPTYGRVSRHGLIALASSLDQIGPLTKTVEDAKIIFEAVSGRDRYDSTTTESGIQNSEFRIKNLRIGVPKEYFGKGLDSKVEKEVKKAINIFEKSGAQIKEINLPHSEYALATYYIILPAEVSANLARFDGIRYGTSIAAGAHAKEINLFEVYSKTRGRFFGPEVKRRIMLGTYALSAGYYDAYYIKAQKVRRLIQDDFRKAFEEVDIIIGPTTPNIAFKAGDKAKDPVSMYLEDIYTVAINLAGLPALSMPCGFVEDDGPSSAEGYGGQRKKLPVGLQIIGKWFHENTILNVGEALEKLLQVNR